MKHDLSALTKTVEKVHELIYKNDELKNLPPEELSKKISQIYKLKPFQKQALFFKCHYPLCNMNPVPLDIVTNPKFTLYRWRIMKELDLSFDLVKNLNTKELRELSNSNDPDKLAIELNKK